MLTQPWPYGRPCTQALPLYKENASPLLVPRSMQYSVVATLMRFALQPAVQLHNAPKTQAHASIMLHPYPPSLAIDPHSEGGRDLRAQCLQGIYCTLAKKSRAASLASILPLQTFTAARHSSTANAARLHAIFFENNTVLRE